VEIGPLAVFREASGRTTVHLARIGPGGGIGRHPATGWQLFAVVDGAGWVAGGDGVRRPIAGADRDAVLWSPGEEHESGSAEGMLAVLVESPGRPVAL
jgi:hypothetical protein